MRRLFIVVLLTALPAWALCHPVQRSAQAPSRIPKLRDGTPKLSDRAVVLRFRSFGTHGERIPQLSDKAAAEVPTLKLRQAQLTIQAQQLLAQYHTQREQLDAEIQAAEEKALKGAGADRKKYKVNDQSVVVEPIVADHAVQGMERKK